MAMAGLFLISNYNPTSLTLSVPTHHRHHHHRHPKPASFKPISPAVRFPTPGDEPRRRSRARGVSVVTRAGPSTNSYILAFFLPLSLIIITVFTALRIGDKLDQDYLEEVALNEALRKAMEEGGDDDDDDDDDDGYDYDDDDDEDDDVDEVELPLEQPVTPRTRINRPIREI